MTAIDMIREGSTAWAAGFPVLIWTTSALLFIAGFAAMAALNDPAVFSKLKARLFRTATSNVSSIEGETLNAAPFPIWSTTPEGTLTYANRFYQTNVEPLPHTEVGFPEDQADSQGRHALVIEDQRQWFSVSECESEHGTVSLALPVDNLLATEATLKRFMETLSTTFAHLSAGLAIFNADKTLHLFNPALSDMLGLDPTWLAMRPSITSFLDKLRENRHLPDQKNFLEWRQLLLKLESLGDNQNYTDQWFLPDGRILRVSGQPHSQGAVAFMFEDITAQIKIERQHRAETALNQAVLDKISDAVVVFDASGAISFANTVFDEEFQIDSTGSLATPTLDTVSQILPDTPNSNAFWGQLRSFISRSQTQQPWVNTITAMDGKALLADISSTPDGSTLVIFKREYANIRSLPLPQKLAVR